MQHFLDTPEEKENKLKFFKLFDPSFSTKITNMQKSLNLIQFEEEIKSKIMIGYNPTFTHYNGLSLIEFINNRNYYIDLYISFYYFNYYYKMRFNSTTPPLYYPASYNGTLFFYLLDYNIGYIQNIEIWRKHHLDVKNTLKFVEDNKLNVTEEIKNLKDDIEVLDKIIYKLFNIIDEEEIINIEELENFEKNISKKIKNKEYAYYTITSIQRNSMYSKKYLSAMRNEYKEIISNVKILEDNNNNLKKDLDKSKDFYLTVSGSVMALIALFSGNITLANREITTKNIIIFNISIIAAILIFSFLFHSIYNAENSQEYGKKFVNILYLFLGLSFITILVLLLFIA